MFDFKSSKFSIGFTYAHNLQSVWLIIYYNIYNITQPNITLRINAVRIQKREENKKRLKKKKSN